MDCEIGKPQKVPIDCEIVKLIHLKVLVLFSLI